MRRLDDVAMDYEYVMHMVVYPRTLRQLHVRNSILHLQHGTHLYLINRAISRRLSTLVLPKVGADKAFNRPMRPLKIPRR